MLLDTPSPRLLAWFANRAALLAGQTDLAPQTTDGIASGPGNQGTRAVAFVGQAGTSGIKLSVPRSQRFGAGGTAQGSIPT